jgi:hypothetical protein
MYDGNYKPARRVLEVVVVSRRANQSPPNFFGQLDQLAQAFTSEALFPKTDGSPAGPSGRAPHLLPDTRCGGPAGSVQLAMHVP